MDYMKRKTREYEQLKREWRAHVSFEDLEFIRGNVLKDVLRTDRSHPYYAGSEDSPHLAALTDLLTTFAITHPQVGGRTLLQTHQSRGGKTENGRPIRLLLGIRPFPPSLVVFDPKRSWDSSSSSGRSDA